MIFFRQRRFRLSRIFSFLFASLCAVTVLPAAAAVIHGVVSDPSGARLSGTSVMLISDGKVVSQAVCNSDGGFQISTGTVGHFFLMLSAPSFRQLETPDFYAGQLDDIERNLVLEPAWVRESIVVTANGSPTPQPQAGEATSVLESIDLDQRTDFISALRQMPGTFLTQSGQMGAQTSLFLRGGNSASNKIQMDGIDIGDLGGKFDFGPLTTTSIERVEVFRGANSSLFGAGAGSGVVSLRTAHGVTSEPLLMGRFEGGNFDTTRDEGTLAGTRGKLDYLAAFNWIQTGNAMPNDEYHVATTAANFGWQWSGNTLLRATLHYGVDAGGSPNAWDFYHVADSAQLKDQDLFISASIDNQTSESLHNTLRYGAARKREQFNQWAQVGTPDAWGDTLGQQLTIRGANGYSVTGSAILDYSGTYPWNELFVNNRDQFVWQADYNITQHLTAVAGFRYADERGVEKIPAYSTNEATERTDEVYFAEVHGDYQRRFYYNLGGSLEHNSLFGTMTSPHAGLSWLLVKPAKKYFSGTRLRFAYGDGQREPALTDEFSSLYKFLQKGGFGALAAQAHIGPLSAPTTRSYEGGVEQGFLRDRIRFHVNLFHDQFGREIEAVGGRMLLQVLPNLTAAQQQQLITALGSYYTYNYSLDVNTQAFRAQGVEATLEGGLGSRIFLRAGYTYSDAVVQRSFTSDNEELLNGTVTTYNGIPVGWLTPLKGARPFRRPPHTGFLTATYSGQRLSGVFTTSYASRSDDSTFLDDAYYGSSLVLPNRNLDYGYTKVDLGGSYTVNSWLSLNAQMENLLSNQHIAPIGYVSLPYTLRGGVRITVRHLPF